MTVRQIQCLLCYLGFDPGAPDGKLGPNTLAAIRRFQAAAHLNVDGGPGPATRQALQEAVKRNFPTISHKTKPPPRGKPRKRQALSRKTYRQIQTKIDKTRTPPGASGRTSGISGGRSSGAPAAGGVPASRRSRRRDWSGSWMPCGSSLAGR